MLQESEPDFPLKETTTFLNHYYKLNHNAGVAQSGTALVLNVFQDQDNQFPQGYPGSNPGAGVFLI